VTDARLSIANVDTPVVVGDAIDPHVDAVVSVVRARGGAVLVLDAASLRSGGFHLDIERDSCDPGARGNARGWIRRLAPAGWASDVAPSSHEGVVVSAWLTLLTGWIASADVAWLTSLDRLTRSDGKLAQLSAAAAEGLNVPRTVLTSSAAEVRRSLRGPVLVKPLGAGQISDEYGHGMSVPATVLDPLELGDREVRAAPFIFQELVPARHHLRVVTVGDQAFAASLDASGLPIDWRQHPPAHEAFVPAAAPEACRNAVQLARRLCVGFSSQDWIDTGERLVFLDLNPAGQWLFLPDAVAEPVTDALAAWLLAPRP